MTILTEADGAVPATSVTTVTIDAGTSDGCGRDGRDGIVVVVVVAVDVVIVIKI